MTITAKPILFTAPMIKALLREIENPGTGKTQTRRIIKPQPVVPADLEHTVNEAWQSGFIDVKCPYGKPGDLLYVRETWACHWATDDQKPREIDENIWSVLYYADESIRPCLRDGSRADRSQHKKKRVAIHMPRWASRITLEITDVVPQRIQDISEEDVWAEGIVDTDAYEGALLSSEPVDVKQCFSNLWTSINGPESWEANPWVWAVSFKPHLINVDRFIKERAAA